MRAAPEILGGCVFSVKPSISEMASPASNASQLLAWIVQELRQRGYSTSTPTQDKGNSWRTKYPYGSGFIELILEPQIRSNGTTAYFLMVWGFDQDRNRMNLSFPGEWKSLTLVLGEIISTWTDPPSLTWLESSDVDAYIERFLM